jgi:hypothetical protein
MQMAQYSLSVLVAVESSRSHLLASQLTIWKWMLHHGRLLTRRSPRLVGKSEAPLHAVMSRRNLYHSVPLRTDCSVVVAR